VSLDAVKIAVLSNRGRVEISIGGCRAELSHAELVALQRDLHGAADRIAPGAGTKSSTQAMRLLTELERAAAMGRACPTNMELMELLGLANVACVADMMRRLRDTGRIEVFTTGTARMVRIVATGAQTAAPAPGRRLRALVALGAA